MNIIVSCAFREFDDANNSNCFIFMALTQNSFSNKLTKLFIIFIVQLSFRIYENETVFSLMIVTEKIYAVAKKALCFL